MYFKKKVTWENIEYFDNNWNSRTERLSHFIGIQAEKVADIGCGQQHLKSLLGSHIQYIPIDYRLRSPETIVVDFNSDYEVDKSIFEDVVFMSGFLEYVEDVDGFLKNLKYSRQIVLSYCTVENFPNLNSRKSLAWNNHLSVFDLIERFLSLGFKLSDIGDINKNTLFNFTKL